MIREHHSRISVCLCCIISTAGGSSDRWICGPGVMTSDKQVSKTQTDVLSGVI